MAAQAADPNVATQNGQSLSTWNLAKEYDYSEIDNRLPDWAKYITRFLVEGSAKNSEEP